MIITETKGIQVVKRNFSFGRFIKVIFLLVLLAILLNYCWNRVQLLTGACAAEAEQHLNNNGAAVLNTDTTNSPTTTAPKKNDVSSLSFNSGVRDYNAIPGHGRYQKNLQQLNESTQLGEQDELIHLSMLCKGGVLNMRNYESHWDTRRQAYVDFAPDKKSIVWNAQAPACAVAQLQQSCQFPNSPPLQDGQLTSKESARQIMFMTNCATLPISSRPTNKRRPRFAASDDP